MRLTWNQYFRCFLLALFIPLFSTCAPKKIQLPEYSEFASIRGKAVPGAIQEIYGRFSATSSGKTARSTFNLLLNPGNNAYLEILNPSGQLIYVLSVDLKTITLLWTSDG